jgi:hypothetical protein
VVQDLFGEFAHQRVRYELRVTAEQSQLRFEVAAGTAIDLPDVRLGGEGFIDSLHSIDQSETDASVVPFYSNHDPGAYADVRKQGLGLSWRLSTGRQSTAGGGGA